jgi:phosphate transport system substrate-binding protein
MTYVQLKNKDGQWVSPSDDAFKAAAAGADWNKTFYQITTEQPGKASWPLTNPTYVLMYKSQDKAANASAALKFFDWAYANGDKMADELDYVPLPANVKELVRKQWADQIKDAAGKPVAFK